MEIRLLDIFAMGVDYGQLLMEEERDTEESFDAFQGYIIDQKYNMPSNTAPRRQARSDNWRNAKRKSKHDFMEICDKIANSNEFVFIKP